MSFSKYSSRVVLQITFIMCSESCQKKSNLIRPSCWRRQTHSLPWKRRRPTQNYTHSHTFTPPHTTPPLHPHTPLRPSPTTPKLPRAPRGEGAGGGQHGGGHDHV